MALSAHPIDPSLTAISVAYRNTNYIADQVAPRIPVGAQNFTFHRYADETFYQMPETLVGRRSKPREINLTSVEVPGTCEDHGLDGGVPNADIKNAETYRAENGGQIYDPLGDEVMLLTELVAARREFRVATVVSSPDSYDPALQMTLGAGDKFDDPDTDIIGIINESLDKPLMRPNQIVIGQRVWTKLKSHPQIVAGVRGNDATAGNILRQQFAELFEVEELLVGGLRGNIAKPGQPPNIVRLWGNNIALLHRAAVPQAKGVPTFIGTFQWGPKIAMQWPEPNMGVRGGIAVRSGESVVEKIIAKQAGYLLKDVLSA